VQGKEYNYLLQISSATFLPNIIKTSRHGPSGRDGLTFCKFSLGKTHMP